MRIATWNIERLRHGKELPQITDLCEQIAADIFVLTETDTRLNLNCKTCVHTIPLADRGYYRSTERRVSLFSKYELARTHETFDDATAVCAELITERGALIIYGTIIGIFGNRNENFKADLPRILTDIDRLATKGKPLCVLGDYNCSFVDNYYFTKDGRAAIEDTFTQNNLELLTRNLPECIDHIAISCDFAEGLTVSAREWNRGKELSDHNGVCVELL